MYAARKASLILVLLIGTTSCVFWEDATALIHVVGGSDGWEIPPNVTFYEEWARGRRFGIHDKLVFPYRTGAHNVLQVSEKDFETCGNDNVTEYYFRGPTIIQLNNTGDYYYYSGVGTHCEAGQKLRITVLDQPGSSGMIFNSTVDHHDHPPAVPAPASSGAASSGAVGVFSKICFALALVIGVIN